MKSRRVLALGCALGAALLASGCKNGGSASPGGAAAGYTPAWVDEHAAAAAARKPADVKIPWDGADLSKPAAIKRFGRFIRNDLWERLEKMSVLAVERGDTELLAMGCFYLGYVRAREIPTASDQAAIRSEVLELVLKAVELGYRNPHEILSARPLLPLHDDPRFRAAMEELEAEFDEGLKTKTKQIVDDEFRGSAEIEQVAWRPEIRTLDGESLWTDGPQLVVVTRIHHDGFNKLLPRIQALQDRHGDKLPIAVVFHQVDLADAGRIEQTEDFIQELGIGVPCAVIGREDFRALTAALDDRHRKLDGLRKKSIGPFNPFEPLGLFLRADKRTLYLSRGVIADWELDYIAERFLAATSPEEAPPPVEPEGQEP